jgi:hypothetical protein
MVGILQKKSFGFGCLLANTFDPDFFYVRIHERS